MNSQRKQNRIIKNLDLIILGIFYSLCFSFLTFAQTLNIRDDLATDTLILVPQNITPPSPLEGQLYYNNTDNLIYYYNGTDWLVLRGSGDTTIGSAIVASNTANATRADYVCDGTQDETQIRNAISSLGTTGGAVYLLEGSYSLQDEPDDGEYDITLSSNQALIGTGAGTILGFYRGPDNRDQWIVIDNTCNNTFISQVRIKGGIADIAHNGLKFINTNYCLLENTWIENRGGPLEVIASIKGRNVVSNNFLHYLTTSSGCIASFNSITKSVEWDLGTIVDNIIIEGGIKRPNTSVVVGNNVGGDIDISDQNHNIIGANRLNGSITGNGTAAAATLYNNLIFSNEVSGGISIINDHLASPGPQRNLIVSNSIFRNSGTGMNFEIFEYNLISSNYISISTGSNYGINIYPGSWGNHSVYDNYLVGNFITGDGVSQPINDRGTRTRYTDKVKINLEPGNYTGLTNGGTLTPQGAVSFLRLTPTSNINLGNPNIAPGKSAGDILIIENAASDNYYVRFKDGQGIILEDSILTGGNLELYPQDILVVMWNGANWVEIGYSNN